ncbi:MAG: flagellar assembly protein FliW [candidate division Zixibacteria bacterium]|nr:flagellar assembly protein FliW [candidate division Zixibacteria bacterium]
MRIRSLRFGELDVPESKIITMARPILGFEACDRFCLVEVEELAPFLWFQSVEHAEVTFMVVNPSVFYPDYRIEINSKEIAELRVEESGSVETYVIVTIPDDPHKVSVNLQGPVLINSENNLAKQLVLVNSRYRVRHYLMDSLESDREPLVTRGELVGV